MTSEAKNSDKQAVGNIIIFYPESWGEAEKFYFFASSTYKLKPNEAEVLKGILGHLNKYNVLFLLAKNLMPTIKDDRLELQRQGYSDCMRSRELAAIIETLYCELYSAIDCTRRVIKAIYPKYVGIPSHSTSKLFTNATDGKLDKRIPDPIINALRDANTDWFPELRRIRNVVVHSNVGTCREHEGRILYWNEIYKEIDKQLVIEDVFTSVSLYYDNINRFVDAIFQEFNATLQDKEMNVLCGVFDGRIYERYVSPTKAQDIHSGRCKSFVWFEKEGTPTCPLSSDCGAYESVLESREKAKIDH